MLNWELHKTAMVEILKDIYETLSVAPYLGFKGGTAAYLFYDLPRYSVDLDFDLLSEEKEKVVFVELEKILSKHGEIMEKHIKRYTIFFLLSYGKNERNIKIEISRRGSAGKFLVKDYLGISMKVMEPGDMFACKLAALADRKKTASRDFFDVHCFFSKHWDINKETIVKKTKKNILDYIEKSIEILEKFDNKYILQGLGELLDAKQKDWVKNNLKKDLIFQLKLYREGLKKSSGDFS
ncbi:MAG TPA: hypothetical protein DCS28_03555 [Candidatus Moranbacteria bacterium]|nr:hypothetical protein [Candidatus Moranbacteria bacterium]HAT75088.1 hypothetical protein [Candidatus Moranbacteria bacterium]